MYKNQSFPKICTLKIEVHLKRYIYFYFPFPILTVAYKYLLFDISKCELSFGVEQNRKACYQNQPY